MGGKASAELANLYRLAIESAYTDKPMNNNRMEEAKSWFNTWRYIDDDAWLSRAQMGMGWMRLWAALLLWTGLDWRVPRHMLTPLG